MSKPKKEKITVLCLGTIVLSNQRGGTSVVEVDDNDVETGEVWNFSKLKGFYRGCIYEINITRGETGKVTIASNCRYVRTLESESRELEILVEHEAALVELALYAQERKAQNDKSSILDALEPIARMYRKTNHINRLAIEVRILDYLRNSGGKG